jgi:hypothetical protein
MTDVLLREDPAKSVGPGLCREQTMSDKKTSFGLIPIFGMLLGVVISSMTDEWWWVGVGFAVGLAVEAARARRK